jgi:periplasmic protein TonB
MSHLHLIPVSDGIHNKRFDFYQPALLALGLHLFAWGGIISAAHFITTIPPKDMATIEASFQMPSRETNPIETATPPNKAKQASRNPEPKPAIAPAQESKLVTEQAIIRSGAPAADQAVAAAPIEQKVLPFAKTVESIRAVDAVEKPMSLAAPKEPVVNAPVSTPALFNAVYLNNPPPLYPAVSRLRNETGTTMLRVHISAGGQALAVDVSQSSGSSKLDQAAVNAVRKWRFVAAKRGGTAVDSWVTIPIEFNINQ